MSGAYFLRKTRLDDERKADIAAKTQVEEGKKQTEKETAKSLLRTPEIELSLGKQIMGMMLANQTELGHRVAKMRRKFAQLYGFVVPEIKLSDEVRLPPKSYCIKIHGTEVASYELRPHEVLIITAGKRKPDVPGDDAREPAFGLEAMWVPDMFASELKRAGYSAFDPVSVHADPSVGDCAQQSLTTAVLSRHAGPHRWA